MNTTLNKLPKGSPLPRYRCTATTHDGFEFTEILTEWWFEGHRIETIEDSAADYFYTVLDKQYCTITCLLLPPEVR